MADDFGLGAMFDDLGAAVTGEPMRAVMVGVGKAAERDADEAVRGVLGDRSMSNWWRGKPIALTVEAKATGTDTVELHPGGASGGPWRVSSDGRKTGRHGRTRGKNTWPKAEALIAARWPQRALDGFMEIGRKIVG